MYFNKALKNLNGAATSGAAVENDWLKTEPLRSKKKGSAQLCMPPPPPRQISRKHSEPLLSFWLLLFWVCFCLGCLFHLEYLFHFETSGDGAAASFPFSPSTLLAFPHEKDSRAMRE